MFEKLQNAFSNASKSFSHKELNEKDIKDILFELEIALLESDVASEVIDSIQDDLKSRLIGTRVDKKTIEAYVRSSLIQSISQLFDDAVTVDLFANIDEFKEKNEPYIILFVGINGTGKTTSLAKIAYLLQKSKYSVVVAAADTFRAGAIEQLKEHTKRLNLKIVAQNYGSDPAAVSRDAVLYAKSHKVDCVLIDTAGRMQTNKNLMEQIEKITKVVKPQMKIFVGDSLAGNDTVNQAREFYTHTNFDGAILTKSDADARGGAALSIVKVTKTPVMFIGVGQEYGDLKSFDKEVFLSSVFGNIDNVDLDAESKDGIQASTKQADQASTPQADPEPASTPQADQASPKQVSIEQNQPEPASTKQADPEPASTPQADQASTEAKESNDPFDGIGDADIAQYSDWYDVAPPESDADAQKMAKMIRQWIKNGKPKPTEKSTNNDDNDLDIDDNADNDNDKPKKKRGLFGLFKK